MKRPKDHPSLFGYISPTTGEVTTHPPLCCCGQCQMPVEEFKEEPCQTAPTANTN